MKKSIGGLIAILLAIVCFVLFPGRFLDLLAGAVPILLLLGGAAALYVYRENQMDSDQTISRKMTSQTEPQSLPVAETKICEPVPVPDPEPMPAPEPKPDPEPEPMPAPDPEPVSAPPEFDPEAAPEADTIPELTGNTVSMVFHVPGCKFAVSKNCTVRFKSRDEAVESGYKPCGICRP